MIQYLQGAGNAALILEYIGQQGLEFYVQVRCRSMNSSARVLPHRGPNPSQTPLQELELGPASIAVVSTDATYRNKKLHLSTVLRAAVTTAVMGAQLSLRRVIIPAALTRIGQRGILLPGELQFPGAGVRV